MTENTKRDIPEEEEAIDVADTDLDLPDLPGKWEWRSANHVGLNHKANVYFGINVMTVGGWLGEIDNYIEDGEEWWCVHVRPIVEAPDNPYGNRPREDPETVKTFESLGAAIESVPGHIKTHYPEE